jgi:copper homeostasis protein
MKSDIVKFKEMGCKGIVSGILNDNNSIDMKRTKQLIELSRPLEFTFHRAFDIVTHPLKELEKLIELGVDRVLTSGQKNKAIDGLELMKKLKNISKNRIKIMPGSGIKRSNIPNFKFFDEIHGSFKKELNTVVAVAKG